MFDQLFQKLAKLRLTYLSGLYKNSPLLPQGRTFLGSGVKFWNSDKRLILKPSLCSGSSSFMEGYISPDQASYLSVRKTKRQEVLIWAEKTRGFKSAHLWCIGWRN